MTTAFKVVLKYLRVKDLKQQHFSRIHTKIFPLLSTCKNTNVVKTQFTGYLTGESPLTGHLIKTKRGKKEFAAFA